MKVKLIILATCMAVLAGCSGAPSESVMSGQIQKTLNKEFGVEFVEVKDLEKLNGREDGEKYIADVAYDLKFTKSSKDVGKAMGIGVGAGTMVEMMLGKFKAGDTKHIDSQSIKFAKSENGWIAVK